MKGNACLAALAALILFSAVAAHAQAELLKRVSLDMNAAAPPGVFEFLAGYLGLDLALDPKVQKPVTIRVENVTARTALDAICESIGCRWRLDARKLVVEAPEVGVAISAVKPGSPAVTIERLRKPLPDGTRFENTPLRNVMQRVSEAAGLDIELEGADPAMPLTLDLSGQPLIDAIKHITTAAGFEGSVMVGGFDDAKNKRFKLYIKGKAAKK